MKVMNKPNPLGSLSVSIDPRELSVEIPHLLQLEYALECWGSYSKNDKRPAKSRRRLDVYRAVRSAGQLCRLTVPQVAMLAGCCVRECQKALADLVHLGWLEKAQDVAAAGGVIGRADGRTIRVGNAYRVNRPSWAWDGTHHKHLGKMAKLKGIGVQALHPYFAGLESEKPSENKDKSYTGANSAPVQGCKPAAPLFLTISNSRNTIAYRDLEIKQSKERAKQSKKVCTRPMAWPAEAQRFADSWKPRYKRPLFCNRQNLARWQELVALVGDHEKAILTAVNFLACDAPGLTQRHHALAVLIAAFDQYQPLDAPQTKPRPILHASPSLLDQLMQEHPHAN